MPRAAGADPKAAVGGVILGHTSPFLQTMAGDQGGVVGKRRLALPKVAAIELPMGPTCNKSDALSVGSAMLINDFHSKAQ